MTTWSKSMQRARVNNGNDDLSIFLQFHYKDDILYGYKI